MEGCRFYEPACVYLYRKRRGASAPASPAVAQWMLTPERVCSRTQSPRRRERDSTAGAGRAQRGARRCWGRWHSHVTVLVLPVGIDCVFITRQRNKGPLFFLLHVERVPSAAKNSIQSSEPRMSADHTAMVVMAITVWTLCAITCLFGSWKICTIGRHERVAVPVHSATPPVHTVDKAVATDVYVEMA